MAVGIKYEAGEPHKKSPEGEKMKCDKCHRPMKENTDGNERYCQGHGLEEGSWHSGGRCEHLTYHKARNGKWVCAVCDKEFDSFDELVYEQHSRVG